MQVLFRTLFVRFFYQCLKNMNTLRIRVMTDKKIFQNTGRTKKNQKTKRITIRLTEKLWLHVQDGCLKSGLSFSAFLRKQLDGAPLVAQADLDAARELRRLGAMLKHLYPKESNWSAAEKRQYWVAMHTLLGAAKKLDGRTPGK